MIECPITTCAWKIDETPPEFKDPERAKSIGAALGIADGDTFFQQQALHLHIENLEGELAEHFKTHSVQEFISTIMFYKKYEVKVRDLEGELAAAKSQRDILQREKNAAAKEAD